MRPSRMLTGARMRIRSIVPGLIMALALLSAGPAFAADGGDHWSIFNEILPQTTIDNVRTMWGSTWIEGNPAPDRVIYVFMSIVVFFVALLLASLAVRKLNQPGDEAYLPEKKLGLFTVFELVGEALLNLMTGMMGKKHAYFFFPLILALAVFIFLGNFLGTLPGLLPATDNLNTTLALGLVVFVVTHIYGVREQGAGPYIMHLMGPIRAWYALPLMLLMLFIEIIGHLVRPLSLAMRLMGNMVGDHKVLGMFLAFNVLFLPLPVMVLGLIVVTVQTVVFCLLSIIYITLAVEHAEDH